METTTNNIFFHLRVYIEREYTGKYYKRNYSKGNIIIEKTKLSNLLFAINI